MSFWKQSIYERVFLHQEGELDCGLEAFSLKSKTFGAMKGESGSGKRLSSPVGGILAGRRIHCSTGRKLRNERGSKRPLAGRIDWLCFSIIQPAPFHLLENASLATLLRGKVKRLGPRIVDRVGCPRAIISRQLSIGRAAKSTGKGVGQSTPTGSCG